MAPFDASCIEWWRCINIVGAVLLFGAVYYLAMKMWRVFGLFGIWVTKLGGDIVELSLHCSSTRLCCVIPCDVYTSKFGTCPTGGDGLLPAERCEEMFSMNRINNEDKEYWTPFVSP